MRPESLELLVDAIPRAMAFAVLVSYVGKTAFYQIGKRTVLQGDDDFLQRVKAAVMIPTPFDALYIFNEGRRESNKINQYF
ncbi:MAG: hypothetical protein CMH61_00580 [Nanoarchaeota archaeon]|nr:hypothetical protein [Nanoarchaeota archaeon]|tara:strand:- start:494 stop:736 length:243 start_codon:yes stop_codon:yes gene_type:complete